MGRGWAGEAGGGDEKNPIATGCSRDPDRQTPACVGGTAVALDREALVGALGGGYTQVEETLRSVKPKGGGCGRGTSTG